jgi:hypothetical protein
VGAGLRPAPTTKEILFFGWVLSGLLGKSLVMFFGWALIGFSTFRKDKLT